MAERTLRLTFENSMDDTKSVIINVPLADDTKTGANVKSVMGTIYANRSIFNLDIGNIKSAGFVTPQVIDYLDLPA